MPPECVLDDCTKPRESSDGLCGMHAARKRRNGDPRITKRVRTLDADTLRGRVERDSDGCLLFTGMVDDDGYGRVRWKGKEILVHRLAFQIAHGELPAVVGHRCHDEAVLQGRCHAGVCKHRRCTNREHLYAQTVQTSGASGDNLGARNARKTHCPKNHELPPYEPGKRRNCKVCRAARERARHARIRAERRTRN